MADLVGQYDEGCCGIGWWWGWGNAATGEEKVRRVKGNGMVLGLVVDILFRQRGGCI